MQAIKDFINKGLQTENSVVIEDEVSQSPEAAELESLGTDLHDILEKHFGKYNLNFIIRLWDKKMVLGFRKMRTPVTVFDILDDINIQIKDADLFVEFEGAYTPPLNFEGQFVGEGGRKSAKFEGQIRGEDGKKTVEYKRAIVKECYYRMLVMLTGHFKNEDNLYDFREIFNELVTAIRKHAADMGIELEIFNEEVVEA